jgi:hypothetical protein
MQSGFSVQKILSVVAMGCLLGAAACGPSGGSDASTDVPTANTDNPSPTDGGGTLYARLGGRMGIANAVDAIVTRELMDPEIASYFYFQVTPGRGGMPPVDGHPNVAQLKSCLVNQLASAAGGPEMYPGMPADNMGWQCRSMSAAHNGLNIPNSVFDRFVTIAAGVLMTAGVAPADIMIIGGVLNSTKADVAQGTQRDGGAFMPPVDAAVGPG